MYKNTNIRKKSYNILYFCISSNRHNTIINQEYKHYYGLLFITKYNGTDITPVYYIL